MSVLVGLPGCKVKESPITTPSPAEGMLADYIASQGFPSGVAEQLEKIVKLTASGKAPDAKTVLEAFKVKLDEEQLKPLQNQLDEISDLAEDFKEDGNAFDAKKTRLVEYLGDKESEVSKSLEGLDGKEGSEFAQKDITDLKTILSDIKKEVENAHDETSITQIAGKYNRNALDVTTKLGGILDRVKSQVDSDDAASNTGPTSGQRRNNNSNYGENKAAVAISALLVIGSIAALSIAGAPLAVVLYALAAVIALYLLFLISMDRGKNSEGENEALDPVGLNTQQGDRNSIAEDGLLGNAETGLAGDGGDFFAEQPATEKSPQAREGSPGNGEAAPRGAQPSHPSAVASLIDGVFEIKYQAATYRLSLKNIDITLQEKMQSLFGDDGESPSVNVIIRGEDPLNFIVKRNAESIRLSVKKSGTTLLIEN